MNVKSASTLVGPFQKWINLDLHKKLVPISRIKFTQSLCSIPAPENIAGPNNHKKLPTFTKDVKEIFLSKNDQVLESYEKEVSF